MDRVVQKNIVLIGFMGTGKSTVGAALAARLGYKLVDTDEQIVLREQKAIPDIFSEHGESYFRKVESEVIRDVMQGSRQVVSTGGGAVLAAENRERMLAGGFVVALTAELETIAERVGQTSDRPLLQGDVRERIRSLLEARKNAYDFAHYTIATDKLSVDEIAERILAAAGLNPR